MKRVLVLDAMQRSALAAVRSLGRKGVHVLTADTEPSSLAGESRYSQQYLSYPPPASRADEFISRIAAICREHEVGMILPMTELTGYLLAADRKKLTGVDIPLPDLTIIEQLSDKCVLLQLADRLGVPCPRTWRSEVPGRMPDSHDELPWPLVLKPCRSWLQSGEDWLNTGVRFASTPKEAAAVLTSDRSFSVGSFMVQEHVPGTGYGIFALYNRGTPLAFFAHRRIREKPPRGGVSVLSESISPDPDLLRHARALLDHVGWHGVAMVEFRVADDGRAWLMEVNTRFWGSLQLSVDAGIDFPWLLYRASSNSEIEVIDDGRIGNRLRWLLGDLDSLYLTLRDAEFTRGEKLRALGRFLRPSLTRTRHEVNRWNDLRPFFWELRRYIADLSRPPSQEKG